MLFRKVLPEGNRLTTYGVAVSTAWMLVATTIYCNSWTEQLQPNAWGDFIAGMSAPLAFMWLVLGFFQQGIELRQNTEALTMQGRELQLQVRELRASVSAQQTMAKVAMDDHELAKEAREGRKTEEKRAAQPKFGWSDYHDSRSPQTDRESSVHLVNAGPAISSVDISFSGDLVKDISSATRFALWATNEQKQLKLHYPDISDVSITSTIRIEYNDGFGQREYQELLFSKRHPGTYGRLYAKANSFDRRTTDAAPRETV